MKIPRTKNGIESKIQQFEDLLKSEKRKFGAYHDGGGVRYLIAPLYLLLGDYSGALKSYNFFEKNFPDDSGEPFHYLMWSLTLLKNGKIQEAETKLIETMLLNLYLLPFILGIEIEEYGYKHFSNWEEKEYIEYFPEEFLNLWDKESIEWVKSIYFWQETVQIRKKYIKLEMKLSDEPVGKTRSELVKELTLLRESIKNRNISLVN